MTRPASGPRTDERILDAALDAFGTRGYEATSLDSLAGGLGVRKQTILYWFPSKEALLDAVVARSATELVDVLEAAVLDAGPGLERVDAVLKAVFRFGVRRPALLGLLRELDRLGPSASAGLEAGMRPLIDRSAALLAAEMDAGTVRRADPRALLVVLYAAVVGSATELEARRLVGLPDGVAGLRRLRRELIAFVHAALRP